MSNNSQQQAGLIERLRLMELDHEPDSWPAIQMCDVSALLNELERRNYAGKMVAALPVGELTDERTAFERHWLKVRGKKKAENELRRHPLQPQCYVQDSANRHWVTWQSARSQPTTEESSVVAGAQPVREPLTPDTHYQEWKHGCDSMLTNITLWLDRCPHCGKPRPVVEAAHGITKKGEQ